MNIFLNIIILIFEVLYYSLFMKSAKNDGKLWKYIVLFSCISIIFSFINHQNMESCLLLVIMMLLGLKYIVKVKTSLYDFLVIMIMLFFKIALETPLYMLFISITNKYVVGLLVSLLKAIIIYIIKNKLNKIYVFLKNKWDNNNFYIRYIFSILIFIYCIIVVVFFLFLP